MGELICSSHQNRGKDCAAEIRGEVGISVRDLATAIRYNLSTVSTRAAHGRAQSQTFSNGFSATPLWLASAHPAIPELMAYLATIVKCHEEFEGPA